jgi:DNA-binding NtrC family response regulator
MLAEAPFAGANLLDASRPARFNVRAMENHDLPSLQIVLIDDDAPVLRSMELIVRQMGHTPKAFTDPNAGLQWLADNGADILLTDICMPECDGFQVLKRVRELPTPCEVIFVTAHANLDLAIRALREGAADFFTKPFGSDALRVAIERTRRFQTLSRQKQILVDRVDTLSRELWARTEGSCVLLGQSAAMRRASEEIVDLARTNCTVLIVGESGTGKELAAHAIHRLSDRARRPMLCLNCSAIPGELFESEMFGHRRGAFTGAVETRGGYVEAAAGGTIFLDEIGDLPLGSQAKLLRLLEQRTYLPVGESIERTADVRLVAATNQDLDGAVAAKKFRQDLFYRLNVGRLRLPPLRERPGEIGILAMYFTLKGAEEMGKPVEGISEDALALLTAYDFPGNVRELRNFVESAIIHCKHSGPLTAADFSRTALTEARPDAGSRDAPTSGWPLETLRVQDVERRLYTEALARADHNVSAAAKLIGLSRGKLRRRLSALGIANGD